jgi:hypothetical protein
MANDQPQSRKGEETPAITYPVRLYAGVDADQPPFDVLDNAGLLVASCRSRLAAAHIARVLNQSASSEKGQSEEVAELKSTIERMRQRIMGNLADLQIDDYVEVRFKDGSGRLKGNITKLWPEHGQAQINHGWCFHPGDEITKHERGERPERQSDGSNPPSKGG